MKLLYYRLGWVLLYVISFSSYAQITVTNTNNAGAGSLRQAIIDANANPGVDNIVFNIPDTDPNYTSDGGTGNETWTISPVTNDLPEITEGVILDATTQPGTGNYKIKIDGQGTRDRGFNVTGGYVEVYGFYITGFDVFSQSAAIRIRNSDGLPSTIGDVNKGNVINSSRNGIVIEIVDDCIIKGNLIGTDETGQLAMGNTEYGISLSTTANRTIIGGSLPGERNLISGNIFGGISVVISNSNIIQGNYIGTNIDGTLAIPNSRGISLSGGFSSNGQNQVLDNLISGNSSRAINLSGSDENIIRGNIIGEATDGSALGNNIGIAATTGGTSTSNNIIGGLGVGERNIIANSTNQAIFFDFAAAVSNTIIGNTIYCNGSGIDLNGVANNDIQPPVITSVTLTSVSGTGIDGDDIHVYRDNSGCTPLQGQEYLGTTTVSGGIWTVGSLALSANDEITATATNSADGTSEFIEYSLAPFITTWKTDNPGSSNDNQITIPTTGTGYFYDVDWGDGMNDTGVTGNITHTYAAPGTYTVSISGDFPRIYFNNGGFFGDDNDSEKILTVEQWGDIAWSSMAGAFSGCLNLRINAADVPDLSAVTDMTEMFYEAEALNDNINNWDVSNVEIMNSLFRDATAFDQPLNLWVTDNVTDMRRMFSFAPAFNQDIGSWEVSNVEDMSSMFGGATSFNQDISGWSVTSVLTMNQMFSVATSFNQDIGGWTMTSVTDIGGMFNGATVFNQDIGGWDVSNVTSMITVFSNAPAFNQDISGWVVDDVNNMRSMFNGATAFDQDISGWNVDNVGDMESMFNGAAAFNQDISGWVVSGVGDMSGMFEGAISFDQDISGWNVSNVDDMRFMFSNATSFNVNLGGWVVTDLRFAVNMFNNSGLSIENYDATLIGWSGQAVRSNVSFGAANIYYCEAEAARSNLITTFNWFITDGGQGCIAVFDGLDTTAPEIMNGQATPIEFGSINILPATKTRNITILNRTSSDLTNVNVTSSGTAFSIVPAAPTVITASSSETINIVLSGGVPGVFSETVSITSDDFTGTFNFDLIGEITATPEPEIVVYEGSSLTGTEINNDQPSQYYFGNELRGNNLTADITITNIGSTSLDISDMSITGSAFSFASITPASVAVGATETVQIILDGSVAGVYTETLTILSNDTDEGIFNFDIEGEIVGPDIAVFQGTDIFSSTDEIFDGQATSLDFGSTTEGSDIVRQITIANFNPLDLNVSDISITGSAFSINATTPFIIAAEFDGVISRITFNLTLSGAVSGSFNESVTITNDDDDEPAFTFNLKGTVTAADGQAITVTYDGSPILPGSGTIAYGNIVQGGQASEILTIENTGTNNLVTSEILLADGTVFSFEGLNFPITLLPDETLDISLALNTDSLGTFTDTITIVSNDPNLSGFQIALNANVIPFDAPEIDITNAANSLADNAAITFTSVAQNDSSDQVLTINNTGTADLVISDIQLATGTAYSISGITLPSTIEAGATEVLTVTLSSATVQTWTDVLTISSNDADESTFTLNLTGEVTSSTFPEIEVRNGATDLVINDEIDFGSITENTSASQTLTISNSGTADLTIVDTQLTTGTAYSISGITLPTTIAAGNTVDFIITLSSDSVQTWTDILTITNDDVDESPFILNLTGEVIATPNAELQVQRENTIVNEKVELGNTKAGNPLVGTFDILNLGDADLIINNIVSSNDLFTVSFGSLPVTISANSSNIFDIELNSTVVGIFESKISITSNDPDQDVFEFDVRAVVEGARVVLLITNPDNSIERIVISDEDVDLGTTQFDVNLEKEFAIENLSDSEQITVNEITSDNPLFAVSNIPSALVANQTEEFLITLNSKSVGLNTAQITVSTSLNEFSFNVIAEVISEEEPQLIIYNVITPNNDGRHDFLFIENISLYPNNVISIFNRWGNKVFETSSYNNSGNIFDGVSDKGEELLTGNYYYVIDKGNGDKRLSGFLIIKR
ncbi:gliding motility-associated C-terminal domain-containing protein [Marivirga sericea]|uniref:Gliding motility-associated C-terminal domain-containing protein n=1 Tax=Marivirga sericea TaxID=1028 RepID=A0A1X7LIR8_9BACT|nr:BspA family leucine-rich repeat surface protein [Marivirga sericea]SMG53427.1 gliding motility-associated C-terminal domain-containing protein [Marivirga sericea]